MMCRDFGGRDKDLVCYNGVPCPFNAYCSKDIADGTSLCCLTHYPASNKRDGVCPVVKRKPSQSCFTDMCKSDMDCKFPGDKCCFNGCEMDCVIPQLPSSVSIQQSIDHSDPCKDQTCPGNQVCRVVKPCGLTEHCILTWVCTGELKSYREGCYGKQPILYRDSNGRLGDLVCFNGAPCPANGYCHTTQAGETPVCCLKHPAAKERSGYCPSATRYAGQRCFTDQCVSDADCAYPGDKCCHNGCEMACVSSLFNPTTPTEKPIVGLQKLFPFMLSFPQNNSCRKMFVKGRINNVGYTHCLLRWQRLQSRHHRW